MTAASRKDAREALKAAIEATISGPEIIYPYMPAHFDGKKIVGVVTSTGSKPMPLTLAGGQAIFHFELVWYVLTEEGAADGWTQAECEDAIDDLAQQSAAFIDRYRKTAHWDALTADQSVASYVIVLDAKEYKRERIPLSLRAFA